ncbi:MAG: hypothetical protein J6N92_04355, partial [Alloprevotella sp.]|nr:hypothetical protein [Alloprevotella sp.]
DAKVQLSLNTSQTFYNFFSKKVNFTPEREKYQQIRNQYTILYIYARVKLCADDIPLVVR